MAKACCAKCGSTSFELEKVKVKNSTNAMQFVKCSSCGTVVGTHEDINLEWHFGNVVDKLKKA